MASKFSEFLAEKKIDQRRVLSVSKQLERLRPEDRTQRLKERVARKSEDGMTDEMKKNRGKPRSGRPVTRPMLRAAVEGKGLSGPQKTRLLRVVNHLLKLKKQEPVDYRDLF